MRSSRTLFVGSALLFGLCLAHQTTWAFIQKLFPLQEFIDDSDYIFVATIENVNTGKPSTIHGAGLE
jgi:hypothetical protein